ncbi:GPR endopeptidase [Pseudogracilibacillus auburnensis]|uniref:Germination protease n=1 Tax=Pseudogracilibacillus auburnensis TaxID=1494959 RepID=A0A2V3VX32_9BACI|nr:GPR endopeptidase [Pseudogracilibacillus auburnensis]MBO1003465.1 GPR endopeptidase [Pseudogracilibacillus auburnensis]PXW86547.1 GPR endopeptidase [Pseudogracilibacillus auburnensis]
MEKEYSVRTDLAIEAKDMYVEKERDTADIPGVKATDHVYDHVKVSHIEISKDGEKTLNKKAGSYITIFADGVKKQDTKMQAKAANVLSREIEKLMNQNNIQPNSKGLIVGLGNWNVTPDALGPMTVEKIVVTNHLFELKYETVAKGYRPVAAISPGVMGVTGMETSDIILSIIEKFKPGFVIVIDALASRSIERINETIQITDTGIHPGSGVGNKRKELSKETLGIPVIAIGVPTVVDAVTIASDTLDYLLKHMGREWSEKDKPKKALLPTVMPIKHDNLSDLDLPDETRRSTFLGLVGNLSESEKRALLEEVLTPMGRNLIVTPKEIDGFMADMAHLVAQGINAALHDKINVEQDAHYTR